MVKAEQLQLIEGSFFSFLLKGWGGEEIAPDCFVQLT